MHNQRPGKGLLKPDCSKGMLSRILPMMWIYSHWMPHLSIHAVYNTADSVFMNLSLFSQPFSDRPQIILHHFLKLLFYLCRVNMHRSTQIICMPASQDSFRYHNSNKYSTLSLACNYCPRSPIVQVKNSAFWTKIGIHCQI